jgi:organic hydroperoxide reductase OsmC/OhrA
MTWIETATSLYSTETVWNAGLAGTSIANHGKSLTVGRDGDWSPEHLLLLAAESCVMSTLLALAGDAGIDILGYVSKGQLHGRSDNDEKPAIVLMPCVVVGSDEDAARVSRLVSTVARHSIVAKALGERLGIMLDVRVVPAGKSR